MASGGADGGVSRSARPWFDRSTDGARTVGAPVVVGQFRMPVRQPASWASDGRPSRLAAFPRPSPYRRSREQAHLPAEQPAPGQDPRLPSAHAHPRRPRHPVRPSPQGPHRALGLTVGRRPVLARRHRLRGSAEFAAVVRQGRRGGRTQLVVHLLLDRARTRARPLTASAAGRFRRQQGRGRRRRPQPCQAPAARTRPRPAGDPARGLRARGPGAPGRGDRDFAELGADLDALPVPAGPGGPTVTVWMRVRALPAALLVLLIQGYQRVISPWTAASCRYYPSCSPYAVEAIQTARRAPRQLAGRAPARPLPPVDPGGVDHVPPRAGASPSAAVHRPDQHGRPAR